MRKNSTTSPKMPSHVTLRATLIGVVLIIVNAFWIYHMEIVRYSPETTTVALILNAVIWLIALIILKRLLATIPAPIRLQPRRTDGYLRHDGNRRSHLRVRIH